MVRTRMISVIGAGRPEPEIYAAAREAGGLIARAGYGVVTGGLSGVMEAALLGAEEAGGFTMGILPGSDPTAANPHCRVVLPSGMGQARNVLVVAAGDGVLAVGGAAGTLSEIGHAIKAGKPVVGLSTWQVPGLATAADPSEAVAKLLELMGRGDTTPR